MSKSAQPPDRPSQLPREAWFGVLKRTVREFRQDNVSDWAAVLTYFVASVAFGFYVANFGSYNKTYGSRGGGDRLLGAIPRASRHRHNEVVISRIYAGADQVTARTCRSGS